MNLLAFDLGKRMGIATIHNAEIETSAVDIKDELYAMCTFESWLKIYRPAAVLYENAAFQQGWAGQFWAAQKGILMAICQKYNVACDGIAVGTIKLHITGDGKFSKPKRKSDGEYKMLPALRARGYNITDHNEADALALLLYAIDTGLVEVGE